MTLTIHLGPVRQTQCGGAPGRRAACRTPSRSSRCNGPPRCAGAPAAAPPVAPLPAAANLHCPRWNSCAACRRCCQQGTLRQRRRRRARTPKHGPRLRHWGQLSRCMLVTCMIVQRWACAEQACRPSLLTSLIACAWLCTILLHLHCAHAVLAAIHHVMSQLRTVACAVA